MGILSKHYTVILLVLCTFLIGCKNNKPKEGTIVYDIEYPEVGEDNFLIGYLPKKMTFVFKDNRFASILTTKGDLLTIQLIGNSNTYKVEQTFKFGTQLIKSELNKEEIIAENLKEYGVIQTEFKNDQTEIVGLATQKASITSEKFGIQDILYTQEIEFKDPNWSFPFPEVNGIPLQYEIDRMGLKMKLTAISFSENPIDESVFNIDNNYKAVSYSYFEEVIKNQLDSFMDFGS